MQPPILNGGNMVEIHKLENGITIIFENSKHYNSVGFGVWIKVGSRYESKENNGISHFIEHMLFKGTKIRSVVDISKETAYLGGNLNAYTSKENTSFYVRTLPKYLYKAIDLISDMICNSVIDEEEMSREKGVVCEEIDMYKDSPDDYVHEALQKKIWKKHPLGYYISGAKKDVKGFTREQILEFMDNHYVGENMVISVVGNFDKALTYKYIEEAFGNIKKKGIAGKITTPEYKKVEFVKNRTIEQLHMDIAFRGPSAVSDDRYAFTVFSAIFGGDVNSRLFQEIREKRGLTYSIYSYGSSYYDTGLFQIYAGLNAEQGKQVYELIKNLLEDILENGVTAEEVEAVKHQLTVEMTLNRDNIMTKLNGNAKSYMKFGEIVPFKDTVRKLNAVSNKEVEEKIRKYIVMDEMSYGLVGNIEKTFRLC